MIGLFAIAAAVVAMNPSLQAVVREFSAQGEPGCVSQVTAALTASPDLTERYNALAASGVLKGVVLAAGPGRFGASHKDGVITLTPDFVKSQTPTSGDRDQAVRNLVFILGYEAAKLQSASAIAAADAEGVKRALAATPKGGSIDATNLVSESIQLHIEDEARAYLQGWSDEVDAAVVAKGAPLTALDEFQLLRNGRNTQPLVKAAILPEDQRLVPEATFRFPASARNMKAVVSVLGQSQVPDFM